MSSDSTVTMPLSNSDQIKAKILDLQEMLQKQLPGYESLLHTIHRNLAVDPETVQLLSDEEIGIIVAGLSKRVGIFIVKVEVEKKIKKGGKITLDEL